ncbi:MAG TPA: squalene/phytoene synthase family protein [Solirubrobacteraceae bacterium]|nr:squalene/phytoene synthase family protein [Solirubrobacteraceae bacterium]
MSEAGQLAQAYRHCETVTRRQAANFYYGIRLLSGDRRRAMCAVYAFARRIDDIGDGELAPELKLALLDDQDRALEAAAAGSDGGDGVMLALADAQRRFPLSSQTLRDLIEGVRMDVAGTSYEEFEELVVYCRRVAGAIGRACLAIFGVRAQARAQLAHAGQLADDLGVALQLTNILRDLREDAADGRVYLPAEDLRRFGLGCTPQELLGALDDGGAQAQLGELVHFEAERARRWFARGIALTAVLDRRSAACVLAMAGIYRRLLERIDAHPEEAVRRRIALPAHEKAWVAARGVLPLPGGRGAGI